MNAAVKKRAFSTRDIVFMGVFVGLMAICSWVAIPTTVPFTLQAMAVFLSVIVLGGKMGTLAVVTYVLLGALGLPIFAKFSGGFSAVFGLTGGYILGFIATAFVMWGFEVLFGRKIWVLALGSLVGLLACYTFGTIWFMQVYSTTKEPVGLSVTLGWCVYPFIIPDLIKIAFALIVGDRLYKVYHSMKWV